MSDTVTSLLAEIAATGTDAQRGGYTRPVYSTAELDLRSWFLGHAAKRGLDVETDRNGIIWAWSDVGDEAIVTGSHLDSVPGGGAFDGPLGVASALIAFDLLATRGIGGRRAIAVFPEEEGSRFGVACLGSRLLTGAIDPDRARSLTDADGTTFAEASRCAGIDPAHLGPDSESLSRIGTFVELHVEQGRGLIDLGRPVAVATSILGHGRWRLSFTGDGNHAGTTLMRDRADPMVAAAQLIVAVQSAAQKIGDARATVGRIVPTPGGTNVIASRVDLWLDVRHPDDNVTKVLVHEIAEAANAAALDQGCTVTITEESFSPTVDFDPLLRDSLSAALDDAPVLGTGAGHDAGIIKDHVSTAMLFVRNPTGISHAPAEVVEDSDAEAGALALADSIAELTAAKQPGQIPSFASTDSGH
ncbi:allantoate amidohydrolase [Mycobacterium sp. OTB74]|jgi:N-carbamoyl-L-amino-acid hydrolase|uniref:allantoate amidohydrolase n=1 Tax=Mycobacterium sp. OTB74 TaxID=1853452 RepID=UPI0024737C13|nr:allantoate amidohydrolase [Mycobacterium sp. OTB74]MDH6247587.1 N-carbamoyl-L-amino-acid hydrolase [Mycobacterium sp. OTB74]